MNLDAHVACRWNEMLIAYRGLGYALLSGALQLSYFKKSTSWDVAHGGIAKGLG